MLTIYNESSLFRSFNINRLFPSANALRGADIGLGALINTLIVIQSTTGVLHLREVRIVVNTARGLQAWLSERMRSQLSLKRMTGSHEDRAKFAAMVDITNHFLLDPALLLFKRCSYLATHMKDVQGNVSKLHDCVKRIRSLAEFKAADESVLKSLRDKNSHALFRADAKMLKSVTDISFFIVGLLVGSRVKAGLAIVSAVIAAYKLYVDTR